MMVDSKTRVFPSSWNHIFQCCEAPCGGGANFSVLRGSLCSEFGCEVGLFWDLGLVGVVFGNANVQLMH